MKKTLIAILTAAALLMPQAQAQTDGLTAADATNILGQVTDFLRTSEAATDWTYIPYLSYAKGLKDSQGDKAEWGGGLAALYPLSNSLLDVRGGFRLQYFAGEIILPSVNAHVGGSYKVFGLEKLIWTPSVFTGVGAAVGGTTQNGDVGLMYGAGVSLKYRFTDKIEAGVGYAYEQWTQLEVPDVQHFGLVIRYKF